jgi:bla regulator protein BlaR1
MVASNGVFTMPQLATHLTGAAGRPVLDKTGLKGRYGFFLLWAQLSAESADAAGGSGPPDFFAAVEQQLGLKLQPNREPVEILIVDHAERVPAEN